MHSRLRPARLCCVLLSVAAMVVIGCAPPTIRARGLAPLNLNKVNESVPVKLRLFQLTDDAAFTTASFESLWVDPAKALGGNLVGKPMEHTVLPGTATDPVAVLQLEKMEDHTRFLGVLALFFGSDGSPRQITIPVHDLGKGTLVLSGYSVAFVTGDEPTRAEPAKTETKPGEAQPAEKPAESSNKPAATDARYRTPDDPK